LFATAGHGDHFDRWWSGNIAEMSDGSRIAYAIRDKRSGEVVGSTSFLDIRPAHRSVEIGATFLRPDARSGAANPESKQLMLTSAFASTAIRVELITDVRNLRSRRAIAKLGAIEEGGLRHERITWTGHIRDSVIFSITNLDWPDVRAALHRRLATFE
jgi:RimJ/RimL family protein N-acetyltransferase